MAELLPGVHLVDGVDAGTHVMLLKDPGGTFTLIDSGLPGSDAPLAKYLAKSNIAPTAVRRILLTHLHNDHTGALKRTIALTKAKTFAHWLDAAFIAGEPAYDGPGVPPKEHVVIDEKLKDGDRVDSFGGLDVYHTPGHTPGHLVYHQPDRKILFSGDLFFGDNGGIMLTTPEYTLHTLSAQVSARRVSTLAIDALMTYHGGPVLKDGGKAVRDLVARF